MHHRLMFSWVPIHEEAATRLVEFRSRQRELIELLAEMRDAGMKSTPLEDQGSGGTRFTLREIDPFTFLGNFCRGVTLQNRVAMWTLLKERWGLQASVPEDFEGVPILNNQRSWFMPYSKRRAEDHVNLLWKMFRHLLGANASTLDVGLFDSCLALRGVARASLTMGFFWCRPSLWIAADRKNRAYARKQGVTLDPADGRSYTEWVEELRKVVGGDGLKFSRDAHEWDVAEGGEGEDEREDESDDDGDRDDPLPLNTVPVNVNGEPAPTMWLLAPGDGAKEWIDFQERGIVAMGWKEVGDLRSYEDLSGLRHALRFARPQAGEGVVGAMLWDFLREMKVGDLVFAKNGMREILGWGRVTSEYTYDGTVPDFRHVRAIEWQEARTMTAPERMDLPRQTLSAIPRGDLKNAIRKFYGLESTAGQGNMENNAIPVEYEVKPYTEDDALEDLFMERGQLSKMLGLLRRKKNLILQGAPGTGKTFVARRLAYLLLGCEDESRAPMVQFHQSLSYEDFVQGYRPAGDGSAGFTLQNGIFYNFCKQALKRPGEAHVFIIDEINRGNLSKIFGELMMLIEPDKRHGAFAVPLAYAGGGGETFYVPDNVYIIGTMNTADRSLSMVDYALRRRFGFVEVEPGFGHAAFSQTLGKLGVPESMVEGIVASMKAINGRIAEDVGNLGRGYRIGHSFFVPATRLNNPEEWLESVLSHEIQPLIEEYWMDDVRNVDAIRAMLPRA